MGRLYIVQDLYLDYENYRMYKGSKWVSVPQDACNMLRDLAEHRGKLRSHMDLALAMWPDIKKDSFTSDDTERIKRVICDIRKRLSRLTGTPQDKENSCITNVRGKGYILDGCPELEGKSTSIVPGHGISLKGDAVFTQNDSQHSNGDFQYTRENRRRFEEKRLYEHCETLDALCNGLYKADNLEYIADSWQYLKSNVDSFCRKLERYVSFFHLSVTEAESICGKYTAYIESRLQDKMEVGPGDSEDVLAQEKADSLEMAEYYFTFRMFDVLLRCGQRMKESSSNEIEKEYSAIMVMEYQKDFNYYGRCYQEMEEAFDDRISRQKEYSQSAGMSR